MSHQAAPQRQEKKAPTTSAPTGVLQRKCACGNHTVAGVECEECDKKKRLGFQAKLKITEPEDSYEREADRIADQAAGMSAHYPLSGVLPRIQRFSGKSNGQTDAPPASVDRALASPGRPLEPAIRHDMEQRFGCDFSRVRVHCGAAAEHSARDLSAHAYTVGEDIVFGANQLAPWTPSGRRLLAHELVHVVQQRGLVSSATPSLIAALQATPTVEPEPQTNATPRSETHLRASVGVLQRSPDESQLCGGTWTCAASPCDAPDPGRTGDGGTAASWALKVMIDIEAPKAEDVEVSTIGHTYVEFEDSTRAASTFGFYPDKSAGTPDPMFRPIVRGCVVHPDTNHKSCVDYVEQFNLAKPEFDAALSYAQDACKAPPPYHLQTWNCTTFAVEVAKRAGKSLPPARGRVGSGMLSTVADNPNKLYEGLKRRDIGPTYGLMGDTEVRDAINGVDPATVARIPLLEKVRIVNRLLDGWVSDDDISVIRKIYRNTPPGQRPDVKKTIEGRLLDLTDIGQRTQVRAILVGG